MVSSAKRRKLKEASEKQTVPSPQPVAKIEEILFEDGKVNIAAAIRKLSKIPAFQNFAMQFKNNTGELEKALMDPKILERFGLKPPTNMLPSSTATPAGI